MHGKIQWFDLPKAVIVKQNANGLQYLLWHVYIIYLLAFLIMSNWKQTGLYAWLDNSTYLDWILCSTLVPSSLWNQHTAKGPYYLGSLKHSEDAAGIERDETTDKIPWIDCI